MTEQELDVRQVPKPEKHPLIFHRFDALAVGESLVLVTNHDPKHLREEFEIDHPRGFRWDYLEAGPVAWRIRIGKLAATPLPRVLCDTAALAAAGATQPDAAGAIWKLPMRQRDLDANLIRLRPAEEIALHAGPALDVVMIAVAGGGHLRTELHTFDLFVGAVVWLPRLSRREITAGREGLTYLTVHQRRQALVLQPLS